MAVRVGSVSLCVVRIADLTLTDMPRPLLTSLPFSLLFLLLAFLPAAAETVESTSPLWMQVSPIAGADEFRTLAGFAGDEQMFVGSINQPSFSASGFWGSGEGLSSFADAYSSRDASLFHSIGNSDVSFSGAAFDLYPFGLHWAAGGSLIEADDAPDRTSWFLGVRSNQAGAQIFQVDRPDGVAAHALALNLNIPLGQLRAAHVAAPGEAGLSIIGWQMGLGALGQLAVQFRQGESMRYVDGAYQRWMVSLSGRFGLPRGALANQDDEDQSGIAHTALLAAAAVGIALVASSGSDSTDSQKRYSTQNDAAYNVVNGINPTSVAQNLEYGGWIYRNADSTFSAGEPKKGSVDRVNLGSPLDSPSGTTTTASYHTHGAFDPIYDSEHFSIMDVTMNNIWGVDGYLGTPAGYLKYHHYVTGLITTIGTIAN
ncbi:MAG: DUF4329 domain-containing protein [Gammaproteobacteria bacterium]|nr:DUF4329 domain-containing protein [Gammaproteobacteria bacterium]